MTHGAALAEALARRVATIVDVALRFSLVRSELLRLPPQEAAALFLALEAKTYERDPKHTAAHFAAAVAIEAPECAELRREVAAHAVAQGHVRLARAMIADVRELDEEFTRVPDFGVGRPLTLGERKSVARTRDRELIKRVLRDPSADVIRILLGNPALTEIDVVRLCARRPQLGDVVREVFAHPRWIVRYAVRVAIVQNPTSPLDLALRLAAHLNDQDALAARQSQNLSVLVRDACRRAPLAPDESFH